MSRVPLAAQIAEAEASFAAPPPAPTPAVADRRVQARLAVLETLRWLERNEAAIRAALAKPAGDPQ